MSPTPTPARADADRRARSRLPLWAELLVIVLVGLAAVSLVQHFVLRVHAVASGSMEQTLGVHDRVLSSPLPYLNGGPQRGDIIIFGHGETWQDARREPASDPLRAAARTFGDITGIGTSNRIHTVKRVIGVPGDQVSCCDAQGRVQVNGTSLDEPYVHQDLAFQPGQVDCATDPRSTRCFGPLIVPGDGYLVMGDNRSNSADSVIGCRTGVRDGDCAEFVPAERVTGKVIAKAWPPGPVG